MDSENKPEDFKSNDLSPAQVAQATTPKKTWFFERSDGMIFPAEEKEAWDIINNRSEWKRRDFKLLGVSDGRTYQKITKQSLVSASRLNLEIEELTVNIKNYEKAAERLLVEEAIDVTDEEDAENMANLKKLKRLKNITAKMKKEHATKLEKYKTMVRDIVKNATEAELKVARGNIEMPSAVNIITPNVSGSERTRILNVMGKSNLK